jgi:hypothetical protein
LNGWTCTGVANKKAQWLLPGHDKKTMDEDELHELEPELGSVEISIIYLHSTRAKTLETFA